MRLPDRQSDHAANPLPEVDGAFLKHLLTDPTPPGQPRHHHLDAAGGIDGEHPAGDLGFLPPVERVDQIEPGPRGGLREHYLRRQAAAA